MAKRVEIDSANELLAADYLRRAVRMEGLKAREVAKVQAAFGKDVFPAVLAAIEGRLLRLPSGASFGRVRRLRAWRELLTAASERMRDRVALVRRSLVTDLRELARDEVEFVVSAMGRQYRFVIPIQRAPRLSEVIVTPYEGRTVVDHWRNLGAAAAQRVEAEIVQGVRRGQPAAEIMRRVKGVQSRPASGAFGRILGWASTETQTAFQHVRDTSAGFTHEANKPLVKSEVWTALLEGSCPRCLALHGKVFEVGVGPRPPLHPRCRCNRLPVLKSARQLGLAAGDLPPIVRRTLTGEIPLDTTAAAFLRRQTTAQQNQILGVQKARWWRAGRLELTPNDLMERSTNRLFRLEEIAEMQRIDWEG